MRKIVGLALAIGVALIAPLGSVECRDCNAIPSGLVVDGAGATIETGFDTWGYNYQARLFDGGYCDAYRNAAWCQSYANVRLSMKWNDAWVSNVDCDGDGQLDRHPGFATYRGSGAWLTNHMSESYLDSRGRKQRWSWFTKVVAVPADATLSGGMWYAADGSEIGVDVGWGDFAMTESIYNDTGAGYHGVEFLFPHGAGLGRF